MAGPSGRLLEITDAGVEEIATGLLMPSAVEAGPDGDLYISTPAMGAGTPIGSVLRVDLDGVTAGTPVAIDPALGTGGDCVAATPTA